MDEKISPQAIEQYSEEYAAKLANRFFEKRQRITGPEILALCDIKQVNLFVIRDLMRVWTHEADKLKSPYFDYQAEEVKEVLAQFQNILSNHISIDKSEFLPLLESAVAKTIHLILTPYDFYSDTLDRHGKGYLKTETLRSEVKYLKINKAPLEKLVAKLEERKSDLITGNEAFGMLDHILEEVNFTPEDVEGYINQFSQLVPLRMERLYERKLITKTNEPRKPEQSKIVADDTPKESKPTLADNLARQKSSKLKDSLTINQKFMFTKILFKGDFEIFSEAVDHIDTLETLNHALAYVGENYPEWDRESEEYEEFLEVLGKRFN
ncbi:MAG: hypothetical protein ACKVOQ_18230 [Cyclobacteriaceae bacterium]